MLMILQIFAWKSCTSMACSHEVRSYINDYNIKSINPLPHHPDFKKKALENTVGKGENAGNQHFLLFPQSFLLLS